MDEALLCRRQAQRLAKFEFWDGRLHQTIIDAARNGLLASLYDAINTVRQQPEWAKLKERTVTPERRASTRGSIAQSSRRSKRDSDAARNCAARLPLGRAKSACRLLIVCVDERAATFAAGRSNHRKAGCR